MSENTNAFVHKSTYLALTTGHTREDDGYRWQPEQRGAEAPIELRAIHCGADIKAAANGVLREADTHEKLGLDYVSEETGDYQWQYWASRWQNVRSFSSSPKWRSKAPARLVVSAALEPRPETTQQIREYDRTDNYTPVFFMFSSVAELSLNLGRSAGEIPLPGLI
jgi:hypothetical protein